jgi:hypothetical protein
MAECVMGSRKIKKTDLPFGIQVVLEGKFKKHSNKFSVKYIFPPQLPPQKTYIHDFVNEDRVSYKDKKMLVLSEPTFEQCQYVSQLLQKTYSPELRSIAALVIIGGVEMKVESISQMAEVVNGLKNFVDVFVMPSSNADRRKLYPLQPYNGNFFAKSKN